ncbi:unnamed protein product [Ilex paraguariensis]|uniref:non-specific serine/threonine protein kinase n=1 Tax=Ilex paraguariensis TaxID=185542 RepID=A0ABC8QTM5_9AQUA
MLCITTLLTVTAAATATSTAFRTVGGNEMDRLALQAFKERITYDPQGVVSSWNDSFHFCEWEGVTCGHRHGRVILLDVSSRGLVGTLSPYVGNLSFLRDLWLSNNTFKGQIPSELGRLFRLRHLLLMNNSFEGEIPATLSRCSELTQLAVSHNNLVGKIPKELGSLSKLIDFLVQANHLTGGIPSFIVNLTSLEKLSTTHNPLGGSIPDGFGQMRNLKELALCGNNLSGIIPSSIYNLSALTVLSLCENQLHGNLQPGIGMMFPHLQLLQLHTNLFTGPLPLSVSNLTEMDTLDMQENYFTGKIRVNFEGLKNIWMLLLSENNFGSGEPDEMNFINSMVNCSNLKYLEMSGNFFSGVLPKSIGNLSTNLFFLNFGVNLLNGTLPSTIGNLINLGTLFLQDNQFTGTIPTTIGGLQKVQRFALRGNNFSGKLPNSIGNLTLLTELYLEDNRLDGTIPLSLGNCQNLLILYLSQNNLSGIIPKEIFRLSSLSIEVSLAHNHLIGSLPSEVDNLINLVALDVSENNLSGDIPSGLSKCTSLEFLHMEGNSFRGPIPASLRSLKGLRVFDLSRNNITGQIPEFLGQIALTSLNLSFNNFEGEVPITGVFTNASVISVAGNSRICGGIFELKLPKCAIEKSKEVKMSLAHILIISVASILVGITLISFFISCWVKKKRKAPSIGTQVEEQFLRVSYKRLLKATNGFSSDNLIGTGSFGYVYKGIFDQEGATVAVKVLNLLHHGASKSFMAECETLRNIRHRNLLKIITSCSSVDFEGNDFRALVYEFMPNGSLERWLHSSTETNNAQNGIPSLSFLQRINIAVDVACALDYLHNHCQQPIIHCDLKPSNILLDHDMVAHIGDFGLARFHPRLTNTVQSSSNGIRGTIGYTAPEYGLGSEISTNGDVYSYGICLLEMMTGRRPTDGMFQDGINLHNFVRMAIPDNAIEILDQVLLNDNEEDVEAAENMTRKCQNRANKIKECLVSVVRIGVACSVESPQERIKISDVVHELQSVKNKLLQH